MIIRTARPLRRSRTCLVGPLTVLILIAASSTDSFASNVAGDVIVRFATDEISLPGTQTSAAIEDVTFNTAALEDSLVECNVSYFDRLMIEDPPDVEGALDVSQIFLLTVPDTTDIDSLAVRLMTCDNVRSAHPNVEGMTFTINDPNYPDQWHLENTQQDYGLVDVDLDAEAAWDSTLGSSGVTVHVFDTGITHGDIAVTFTETCGNGNAVHGTQVAGIIAAKANSAYVRGVAPNTEVANMKLAFGLPVDQMVNCMNRATNDNPRVANISGGYLTDHPQLAVGVRNLYLSGDHGCLIVAASGNLAATAGRHEPVYPAAYNNLTLAVSAVVKGGKPWDGGVYVDPSVPGAERIIDVGAPGGEDIVTTGVGPSVSFDFGGTSAATPMVSGVAALLLAADGSLHNDDLWNVIVRTATDIAPTGPDSLTGAGLANVHRAIQFISSPRVVSADTIAKANVSVVDTSAFYTKSFENLGWCFDDMSLPDEETEYLVKRIELEGEASFGSPYLQDVRNVWVRHKDGFTPGWPDVDSLDCVVFVGWGEVDTTGWDSTSVSLRTYTFALHDPSDSSFIRYVPIHPDSVSIPYTAVLGTFDDMPTVEVHSPNGGEQWIGGNRSINWEAADDDGVDSVSIFWSLDDGEEWPRTLATGVTADTTWLWATGDEDTTGSANSRIAVVAYDGGMDLNYDMSDAKFKVTLNQSGAPPLSHTADHVSAPIDPDAWIDQRGGFVYFTLPRPAKTEIAIYDVSGRRVKELVSQVLAKGMHRVKWDKTDRNGRAVASGVYFYRFAAEKYRETGKIAVLR